MSIVKLMKGSIAVDDRGSLSFVNEFDFKNVKRFYVVENHRKGFVRAWHGHKQEGKYVYVVQGSILIGVVSLDKEELLTRQVLSSKSPAILYISPNNYNGFMTLEENTKVMFFSTSTLDESKGDDIRQPYDKWNIWEIEQR